MASPFKHLAVAYDGTEPAKNALALALSLTSDGARLSVVIVVDEQTLLSESASTLTEFDPSPLMDDLEKDARDFLAEARERSASAGVAAELEIVHGKPAAGVLAYASARGCDLIVMGTHGRHGVARFVVGSTAEGVIRDSTIPVLVTH